MSFSEFWCNVVQFFSSKTKKKPFFIFLFHSCTVHLDIIESFIYPTDAQLDCTKRMLNLH